MLSSVPIRAKNALSRNRKSILRPLMVNQSQQQQHFVTNIQRQPSKKLLQNKNSSFTTTTTVRRQQQQQQRHATTASTTTKATGELKSKNSSLMRRILSPLWRTFTFLLKLLLTLFIVLLVLIFWGVDVYRLMDGSQGSISLQYPELAQFVDVLEGTGRFVRCIATVCLIGFQYFLVWSSYSPLNLYYSLLEPEMVSDEKLLRERKDRVHQYGADKMLELFRRQKGLYIKIGQQVASMAGFIPDQYVDTLKVMRNQAPTITFDEVRRVIREDLGQSIEELYESFEPTPIASASLAQVHRATLKDGSVVAVKVQYPYVRTFFDADINARDASSRLATYMYYMQENPDDIAELIELNDSFADEMKKAMRDELDFKKEARNATRARNNFKNRSDVYVPEVMDRLTSQRVLTMEFIDNACYSTDREALLNMGFSLKDVGYKIIDAFAEQTFVHGHLNGDPHPANVLVRRNPKNPTQPQVVILDHGLYKDLTDDFRQQYAKFWQSIVLQDDEGIKEYCDRLGIRDYKLYASMIMMQGYDDLIPAADLNTEGTMKTQGGKDLLQERKVSAEEMMKLEEMMQDKKEDFMNIYRNFPPEMMMIMRTDNLLRALNQELGNGTSVVNRFAIMARAASRGVYFSNSTNDEQTSRTWRDRFARWKGQIKFELRLAVIRVQSWLASLYVSIFGMPKIENIMANLQIREEIELVESAKHHD